MAEPRDQAVRRPAVAGKFYPANPLHCRGMAKTFLSGLLPKMNFANPPRGAIVPHAGWICSGYIAGQAIAAIANHRRDVDVVVVFGAIHTPIPVDKGVFDTHLRWAVPGGESDIAISIQSQLIAQQQGFVVDERFHDREHAVEVELPMIQLAWPRAAILPIEMPAITGAVDLGISVAKTLERAGLRAVYLASSDLTHYGPVYNYTPAGVGTAALEWAMDNDRRLIQLVTNMTPESIVPEAQSHFNACGPGAIAAALAASQYDGAQSATVVRHTNSFQTLAAVALQSPDNAVGYAGIVFA